MAVRLLRCSCRVGATRTPPSFLRCFSTGLSSSSSAASSPAPSGRAGRSRRDDDDRRSDLTPSELVKELDRFIVGQADAKKAVAVALRNRWRRHRLSDSFKEEVLPKNILMVGPTGCGKTEIARRLARVTDAPFVKVEATKFTETGFHGRDVDSIISDLVRVSISQMKGKKRRQLKEKVRERVEQKLLDALTGPGGEQRSDFLHLLRHNLLDQQEIEVEIPVKHNAAQGGGLGGAGAGLASSSDDASSSSSPTSPSDVRVLEFALRGLTSGGGGLKGRKELRKLLIADARPLLEEAEYEAAMSAEDVTKEAIRAAEEDGIVFLDEIDKICSPASSYRYADASAEGVQRDLLPLLEGTNISTKHGDVRTDHILWVVAGAFHAVKPSDMLAELQGRLPIRVELKALTEQEMYSVLTQTENNLIQQQIALLHVDGLELTFTDDAIRHIAKVSCDVNRFVENIGARRLHTIIERLVDDLSFDAPDQPAGTKVVITQQTVQSKVESLLQQTDLTRFLL